MSSKQRKTGSGGVFKSKLAKRQLAFILVFSSLITLFGTVIQLFLEYRTDVGFIQEQFRQIKQAHLESLTWSLWKFDSAQIRTQLKSILSLRDISHIEISDKGKVLYEAGSVDEKAIAKSTQYEMIYVHRGEKKMIGTVTVTASFEGIINRMRNRILIILCTQGLKTFFVSLFILYIINRLVVRHMVSISNFTRQLQPETLGRPLVLERSLSKQTDSDELDQIVNSINEMQQRLKDDIAKIKSTEDALQEREERFRQAFDADAIGRTLTGIDGRLLYTNRSLTEMLGYNDQELGRLSFTDITHPEDIPASKEVIRRLLAKEQDTLRFEKRYLRKDGSVLWADVSTVLLFDGDGKPLHFITGIQDISEHKRAEEALRLSQERMQAILEANPDPVVVNDDLGCATFLNPAFTRLFGWSSEELLGRRIPFVPENQKAVTQSAIEQILQDGGTISLETTRRTKDGKELHVLVNAAAISDEEGKPAGMVFNLTDLSMTRKIESQLRQAQKMESIGRLAGGVAHDFNNMLSIITGNTELALDDIDARDPITVNLQEIRKAAKRSANLTRQLLAFARKQTISPKVLDLNGTVKGMLKMLTRLIGEDIDLAWLPKTDLWPVMIDPSQIDQILANLCVNARDAIKGIGKVTIETDNVYFQEEYCREHEGFKPGEYVMLAVSDNGNGMDKETISKLFEPFFTTKEVGQGTGLGLATVYGIAKQNDGFINVYSELDEGTTFKIYLPRHVGEMAQTLEKPLSEIGVKGNETILLVEDEKDILQMTEKILERLGYTVLTASIPADAIHIGGSYEGQIDMLITDVIMPKMSGRNLAENLSGLYPGIKCLFMSGYTANVIAHHGVLDKGIHFINKPFSTHELAIKVREVLSEDKEITQT